MHFRMHPESVFRANGRTSEVGSGLHLHLDSRGLVAARGGGAGPVLTPYRGLVHAIEHDGTPCAWHAIRDETLVF